MPLQLMVKSFTRLRSFDDEGLPLEGQVLGSEPAALPAVGSHVRLAVRSFNTEDNDDVNLKSTLDKAVPQPTNSPSGVASAKDAD